MKGSRAGGTTGLREGARRFLPKYHDLLMYSHSTAKTGVSSGIKHEKETTQEGAENFHGTPENFGPEEGEIPTSSSRWEI